MKWKKVPFKIRTYLDDDEHGSIIIFHFKHHTKRTRNEFFKHELWWLTPTKFKTYRKDIKHQKRINDMFECKVKYCNSSELDFVRVYQRKLKKVKKSLQYLYTKCCIIENDFRRGEETYGYNSIETIINDIIYVRDRWYRAFRIRWLINLIDIDLEVVPEFKK